MEQFQNSNKRYIKSFDLLRVIALLGVFFYHLMPNYVPSGYLGVVIFFVFAGFLTMKNTIDNAKDKSTGIPKIKDKILKLYPALLLTIICVTICMCCYFKNFLIQFPIDAISGALSVNNYAQIIRNESYFEAMNSIKPLTHIWALSLEFQFYVAFFLLVFPFYKKENKKKYLVSFSIITIISIAISIFLVTKEYNLTRIYYGFDTRISTFLIGAIGAIVADDFSEKMKSSPQFVKLLEVILAVLMIYAMIVSFNTDMQVISIIIIYSLFCILLTLLLYSDNWLNKNNKITDNIVVNALVKRSYVIYLTHYPIIIFSNRFLAHANIDIKMYYITIILITVVVSEIAYRITTIFSDTKKTAVKLATGIMFLVVIASSVTIKIITAGNDDIKKEFDNYMEAAVIATDSEVYEEEIEDIEILDEEKELLTPEELNSYKIQTVFSRINKVNNLIGGDATLTREEFLQNRNMKISFIGDSVTQGARGSLSVYFPNGIVNAEGNRQLRKALPIFYEMKEKGELGDVVVVALGTNSDKEIRVDVLEEIYENLENRIMIILTVAIPYVVEEQQRNLALRKFADTHDNCHIADWYTAMKTHKEYFMGDDTHPQGLGTDVYAQLIFKTAIASLEWRKIGNEWQYFGSDDKMQFAVDVEKNIGDVVEFGSYYINDENKKEPIEWIIVDKNEELKTELLISKKALDRKKFNEVYASTTWQKSPIRKWLNNEFYNEAFENVGAKFVLTSPVDNHQNPIYKTVEGSVTYDKVFLPSYEEVQKYLKEETLKCEPTKYFENIGGYVSEEGYVDWWLRTAGDADNHTMNISANGEIILKGDYVNTDDFGIRPMIKITYK